jgi:hypothetical protein
LQEDWVDPGELAKELRRLLQAIEQGGLTLSSPIDPEIAVAIEAGALVLEELARRYLARKHVIDS